MGFRNWRRRQSVQSDGALQNVCGSDFETANGGEINCMESGGSGTITITKSITIDCGGTFGRVVNTGANGILVDAAPTDLVRIRNLSIEGAGLA